MVTSSKELIPEYAVSMGQVSSDGRNTYDYDMKDLDAMEKHALQVANVLQTSLDLNKLIEIFAERLYGVVAHDSLQYKNTEETVELLIGQPEINTCTYQITLLGKSLGEITLSRYKSFDDTEIKWFEALLCSLIYPLHNAILYKQAIQTAYKDPVAGVNNRAAMDATLEREVELAHRNGSPLSIIMLDIDHFKRINDQYGHLAGDAVLKGVGSCLTDCIRRSDIVFRYGGEEFAIVLNSTDIEGASFLANRIRISLEKRIFKHEGINVKVTVSAGVALLDENFQGHDLLDAADQALYKAKNKGRNRVEVFAPKDIDTDPEASIAS